MNDEEAFLAAIAAAPEDEAPHKIFADWLDEHDRPEDAAYHRRWTIEVAAEEWLKKFAHLVDADYDEMIGVAESHCGNGWGDYLIDGGKWEGQSTPKEFWKWFEILKKKKPDTKFGLPRIFSCSC